MSEITLRKARSIIRSVLAKGRESGMKPLSVVVLDAGGHVKAFEREDGASPGRFGIAHGKAYGSVMLGLAGGAQLARAEQQPFFMTALNGVYGGQVVPVRGKKGQVIGAVGVTGDSSDNDAAAAVFGVESAGLTGEA